MTNSSLNQGEKIPSYGGPDVGDVVKRGIFKGIASKIRMEKAKTKKKTPRMSWTVIDLML